MESVSGLSIVQDNARMRPAKQTSTSAAYDRERVIKRSRSPKHINAFHPKPLSLVGAKRSDRWRSPPASPPTVVKRDSSSMFSLKLDHTSQAPWNLRAARKTHNVFGDSTPLTPMRKPIRRESFEYQPDVGDVADTLAMLDEVLNDLSLCTELGEDDDDASVTESTFADDFVQPASLLVQPCA